MYIRCFLVIFLLIDSQNCTWVEIDGPVRPLPQNAFSKSNNIPVRMSPYDVNNKAIKDSDSISEQAVREIIYSAGEKQQDTQTVTSTKLLQSSSVDDKPTTQQYDDFNTVETECCGYHTSDNVKNTLNSIRTREDEGEILYEIYALMNNFSSFYQKTVDNLTFAVFVPDIDSKKETDIVWQFREQSNTDEIDVELRHGIVSYMEKQDIFFKLGIVKHNNDQSFNTMSKYGQNFKHGPFIIVQTTSDEEISNGNAVLQFKVNRESLEYPGAKWNCAYWNDKTHLWSNQGIKTVIDEKYVICTSDHLSAFSVLMDPRSGDDDYDNDSIFLTVLSIIGSLLTIPCLIITIVIYCQNRIRRKKISSKIMINCCISLLLLHFSFLLYILFSQILPCWFLNFIVHFGGSATLLWTAADGINMWRKLFVDIFDKNKTVFYRWSKAICWGFPLLSSIVGVLITDNFKESCRIYFKYNVLLYMLPCALIITCNAIFFAIMFINVVCKNKIKSLTGKKRKYIMSLVQVFGLLWCISFPLLWLDKTRVLGHIAFTIFVSNQGIIIFYVRCVNEREIRKELMRYTIYKKIFRHVLIINDDNNLCKNSKREVTGVFALSTGSSNNGIDSYSETSTSKV